jgi:hypothetical protein
MKQTFLFSLLLLQSIFGIAQAPNKISYQAVIRNSNNTVVSNHAVRMRISILQGTATGSSVYTETQSPTTNANGLIAIEIGTGTIVSGSFANIDWANGPYFVKTETDPYGGSNYTLTGTSQLLSVPYALYAKTAGNALPTPTGGTYGQSLFNCNGHLQWGPCLPIVQTNQAATISNDSVLLGGSIINNGGGNVSEYGVVWSTSPVPTVNNFKQINTDLNTNFTITLTGLQPNTQYYVRTYAINETGIAYGNEISFKSAKFQLRQLYAGGIIFYLDSSKEHGLICGTSSIGNYEWGCNNSNVGWGTSVNFGSGLSNTQNIMAACSGNNVAARVVKTSTINGYSDWYLPSEGELFMIKQNVSNFNLGPTGTFWSSSQDSQVHAKRVLLSNSTSLQSSYDTKYTANPVLPIRAF